ncbi:MAG: leucine-rich repeat protein, partial [Acutalibacteraceae bacterium]
YKLDAESETAALTGMVDKSSATPPVSELPETFEVNGTTYTLTAIDTYASGLGMGNTSLTEIVIPKTVTTISTSAFAHLKGLKRLEIPETVTNMEMISLQQCIALKELIILGSVKTLDSSFASNSPKLETVVLPETLETIDAWAFDGCSALTTISVAGSKVQEGVAVLPNSVSYINTGAFTGTGLIEVVLPAGTTSLNGSTFENCANLESVTIKDGGGLTKIGGDEFSGCEKLTTVPDMSALTSIPNYAFYECSSLDLPGTLNMREITSIGKKAFAYCYCFEGDLNLENAEEIGIWAFLSTDITSVTLGGKVEDIPSYAFAWCDNLTSVTIPEGVETIGGNAFDSVPITSIELPNSLTTIGDEAFLDCTNLQSITIGSNGQSRLDAVGSGAFENAGSASDGLQITVHTSPDLVTGLENLPDATFTVEAVAAADDKISDEPDAPTLQKAIDDAEDGGTVTISKNILLTEGIKIPADKTVSLCAADSTAVHIIADKEKGLRGPMFTVPAGSALSLSGGLTLWGRNITTGSNSAAFIDCAGGLSIHEGVTLQYAAVSSSFSASVRISGESAEFMMDGGAISNNSFSTQYGGIVLVEEGASFTMTGGKISCNDTDIRGNTINNAPVYVLAPETAAKSTAFIMAGGLITENHGSNGGVMLGNSESLPENGPSAIATMKMTGGTISNNSANKGGGGVMVNGAASFEMQGGLITGNSAGNGGGVCVYDLYTSFGGDSSFEEWKAMYPGAFTMTGGTISGNSSSYCTLVPDGGCGGGIYVASDNVVLEAGDISGNTAYNQGGGVYVGSVPYTLHMSNTLITENTASTLGGGMWFCPTGDAVLHVTNGAAVFGNTASAGGAGDDFIAVPANGRTHTTTLADRMLGGGDVQWYKDGGVSNAILSGSAVGTPTDDPRYSADDTAERITGIQDYTMSLALKAVVSDAAAELAESKAQLRITGNTALRGGGLGSNGAVVIGEEDEWTLRVTKDWADGITDEQKKPVTVRLKIGDYALDTVTLDASNNWTKEFMQLPNPETLGKLKITVVEEGEEYDASYSEITTDEGNKLLTVNITNSLKPTPSPSPSPSVTPSPVPDNTPSPSPSATPAGTPTPTPIVTPTPVPDGTPTPTPIVTPTPAPEGTPTPAPGNTPAPEASPTPQPEKPETDAPQTGDETDLTGWVLLTMAGAACLTAAVLGARRKAGRRR